ncbi:hypothetical protein EDD11_002737 [Mortierella claussenii]|nr:hypothetical protein EDD11_002737 [Mortierella claussenii]
MAYVRGTTKRWMTVFLGLCVFCLLFVLTPYSDKAIDHINTNWRSNNDDSPGSSMLTHEQEIQRQAQIEADRQKDIMRQQEEEDRREEALERERVKQEESEEQKDVDKFNNDNELFESSTEKDGPTKEPEQTTTDKKDGDDDGEEDKEGETAAPQDGLPTEFNESRFPISSQKLLESTIGADALNDYLEGKAQTKYARDASVAYTLTQANIAYRNTTVYSVVSKPRDKIPPSGNIHDYTSLARYFWKNPKTPDGLPYVRLDGKPNPDMDSVWDYRLLRKVFRDCYYMGQGYFWTGEERYAEKIVYRVKEWFLDEKTYMNPNVKYGSLIFGNDLGRAQAVLDMFKVFGMFDALKAIEGSRALQAEPKLIPNLQTWFTSYLNWLDGSPQANQEKEAKNNHGTYYTVQYVSILEFLGRNDEAKAVLEEAKEKRVGPQIRKDGAQPHETIRPISFFYSTFNLQGLMLLAIQADAHGVDLWHHKGPIVPGVIRVNSRKSVDIEVGGGTIEDAVRYIADYAVRDLSEWPYPDSGTRNLRDVLKMAKMASVVYGQDRWQEQIENLEAKVDETIPGDGTGTLETGAAPAAGESAAVPPEDDVHSFICDLGILSKGRLWHCYK